MKVLSEDEVVATLDDQPHRFAFDRVLGEDSTQYNVYEESAAGLINEVLSGYNATVFAYGQSGTGKVRTVQKDI